MIRGTGIDSAVKLYLKGNGANTSTKIFDDSQNHKTLTVNGDAQISTTQSKFGDGSVYFGGVNSYLSFTSSTGLNFVSGEEKTWSFWFYTSNEAQNRVIIGTRENDAISGIGQAITIYNAHIIFQAINGNTTCTIIGTTTLVNNKWYHVRLTKTKANLFTLYVNGNNEGTVTSTGTLQVLSPYNIGYCPTGAYVGYYQGYLDDIIIQDSIDYISNPTRQRG